MTNRTTKGYTKSPMGKIDLMSMLTKLHEKGGIYKDPNEPFEVWFNRKIEYQFGINGGTDEQGTDRKDGAQNPNPSLHQLIPDQIEDDLDQFFPR